MRWNYRVIRHTGVSAESAYFAIHEVFYDEKDEPASCTSKSIDVSGETVEEMRSSLQRMLQALDKPILDYNMFEKISSIEDFMDNTDAQSGC
jgi:hypothetical protein